MQDFALGFADYDEGSLSPFLQAVKVFQNSSSTLQLND